jgi:DNA processing protein
MSQAVGDPGKAGAEHPGAGDPEQGGAEHPARGAPCATCLRRCWLIAALGGYIEQARHGERGLDELLALEDAQLLALAASTRHERLVAAYESFDAGEAVRRCAAAGLLALCRHDGAYPGGLRLLLGPPAVLYAQGEHGLLLDLLGGPVVAVVGARRATDYGLEMARALGRGLAAAGVTVLSGMALGIDTAAHEGALDAGGPTVAVLAGGADVVYPASSRALYRRIGSAGGVLSEAPPGLRARRWSFLARNRIIAALAQVVVVVEATEWSGSLATARHARDLGRDVAAVPGRATSPLSAGTHDLVREGARLVRDAADVLDLVGGLEQTARVPAPVPPSLAPFLQGLLEAVAGGSDTPSRLIGAGAPAERVMSGLAELELLGAIRRGTDGHYTPLPA